jgi:phosphonate transport system permease protein
MVGAGGIGFELVGSMKLFQYQDTAKCIVVIIAMVMIADLTSNKLRHLIQQGNRK